MAKVKWLTDTLCRIGENVLVEKGPQVLSLPCTDSNLHDDVTAPHYKIGKRDATGRLIRPAELIEKVEAEGGDAQGIRIAVAQDAARNLPPVEADQTMAIVDYRERHLPHLWKVYALQQTAEIDPVSGDPIARHIKIGEFEDKDVALAAGQSAAGEAN